MKAFTKKKKKYSPFIISYFWGFVKRFAQKTFFIFREILLDIRGKICYNILVRLGKEGKNPRENFHKEISKIA